jgi:hypothetical protein
MASDAVRGLSEILLQMKINLAHVSDILGHQTEEIRSQLSLIHEEEEKALADRLQRIDENLTECAGFVEAYRRRYTSLGRIRDRLVQLGGAPGPLPSPLPDKEIDGVLTWCLRELKNRGKL